MAVAQDKKIVLSKNTRYLLVFVLLLLILCSCLYLGGGLTALFIPFFAKDRTPETAEKFAIELTLEGCEQIYESECRHLETIVFQAQALTPNSSNMNITSIYCIATKAQYQEGTNWSDVYTESTITFMHRDVGSFSYNDYSSVGSFSPHEPFDCVQK